MTFIEYKKYMNICDIHQTLPSHGHLQKGGKRNEQTLTLNSMCLFIICLCFVHLYLVFLIKE